jgi:hypothetical protein
VKKKLVLAVCCFALVAIASLVLLASSKNGEFVFSPDGRFVMATHAPSHITPAPQEDAGLKTIFSNLSNYPYATYFSVWGNTIAQGGSNFPFQAWEAIAFTPSANATVTKIEVAAGRQGGGSTGFEVGIYNDANGVPGKAIKSFHVSKLPTYGLCCDVATVNCKAGIPVSAGKQYWIAVTTTPQDVDIYAWPFNSSDMRAKLSAFWCKGPKTYCGNNSGKWVSYDYVQLGLAVFGQ